MRKLTVWIACVLLQCTLAPVALASDPLDETLEQMVRTTLEARHRYREAKQALRDLVYGSEEWEAARVRRDEAYRNYHDHADSLDRQRIRMLARESGESPRTIARMRESGMGWGRIAKEVGVHPGLLGRGHLKAEAYDSVPGGKGHGRGKGSRKAKGPKFKKGKKKS